MSSAVEVFLAPERLDCVEVGNAEMRCYALMGGQRAPGEHFLIDLRQTRFIASLGVRFLLTAAKTAAQRQLRLALLVPAQGPVREVLAVAGLDRLVPWYETEEAALAG